MGASISSGWATRPWVMETLAGSVKDPAKNEQELTSAFNDVAGLAEKLNVDLDTGLSTDYVKTKRDKYGRNLMPDVAEFRDAAELFWGCKADGRLAVINYVVAVFAAISSASMENTPTWVAVSVVAAVAIGVPLMALAKATFNERSLDAFATSRNRIARKFGSAGMLRARRDGNTIMIRSRDIVVGDVLELRAGDRVCADGMLLDESGSMRVDQRHLATEREHQDAHKSPALDRFIFAGSEVKSVDSVCKMLVTRVGKTTRCFKVFKAHYTRFYSLDRRYGEATFARCAAVGVSFASQMFVWNMVQMRQECYWDPSPWSWISLPTVASLLLATTAVRHAYSIAFEKEILWSAGSLGPTWGLATGSVLCTRFLPIVATSLRSTEKAMVCGVFATAVLNARAARAAKDRLEQRWGENEENTGERDFASRALLFALGLAFMLPGPLLKLLQLVQCGEQRQSNIERSLGVFWRCVYIIGSMIYLAHNPPGLLVISSLLLSPSSRFGYVLAVDTCLLGMIVQFALSPVRWLIVVCWMSPRTTMVALCLLGLGRHLLRSYKERKGRHKLMRPFRHRMRSAHADEDFPTEEDALRAQADVLPAQDDVLPEPADAVPAQDVQDVALPRSRSSDNLDANSESSESLSDLFGGALRSAAVEFVNNSSSDDMSVHASRLQLLQAEAQNSGVRWPEPLASLVDDLRQHGLLRNSENILHGYPAARLVEEVSMLDGALGALAEVIQHKIRQGAMDECEESCLYKQRVEEAKSRLDDVAKAKGGWLPGFLGGWQTDRTTVDTLYPWEREMLLAKYLDIFRSSSSHDDDTPPLRVDFLGLGDFLGSGAFGQVKLVDYRGMNAAAKVISMGDYEDNDEEFAIRQKTLESEVETLRRLKSPHIVNVLDGIVHQPSQTIIIMEFVNGGTLERFIAARAAAAAAATTGQDELASGVDLQRGILMDIAAAVAYLHGEGVIHGDIKPANILLDWDGKAKLADFGLSSWVHEQPVGDSTAPRGWTYEWAAPEVMDMQECTSCSDVFSFAVICWQMLTLKVPWEEVRIMDKIVVHVGNGGRLPIPRGSPVGQETLITSCWDQDPRKRPRANKLKDMLSMQASQAFICFPCCPPATKEGVLTRHDQQYYTRPWRCVLLWETCDLRQRYAQ